MMTDQIMPALTAEEWAARSADRIELFDDLGGTPRVHIGKHPAREYACLEPSELPSLIALANAALPDDDPRKITREDVNLLSRVASTQAYEPAENGDYGEYYDALEADVQRDLYWLARKLAALLPDHESDSK